MAGWDTVSLLPDCIFNAVGAVGSTGRLGKSQASASILAAPFRQFAKLS
jgi:hypothetical protein